MNSIIYHKGLSKHKWLLLVAMALLLGAFFYNLGLRVFIEDEGIRCLVALEMMYSGNYIMPTLNDTAYFSKPPLYNWILILFFKLFGEINEWTARIPTVLFLGAFAYLIYRYVKQELSQQLAIFCAMAFLTCGRILFWDSILAFIDIFYSMVTYTMIIVIYKGLKKENYWSLFVPAYFLFAMGYMLKGYPSIAFLGGSLLAGSVVFKRWKYLLHPGHIIGFIMAAGIIGGYFFLYDSYKPAGDTLMPLLEQSTRRTFLKHSLSTVLGHMVSYPFEIIYHFLPWTLLVVFCVQKNIISAIKQHAFVYYNGLTFLVNIIVYWLSPEIYPRYILMLIPILFTVLLFGYSQMDKQAWQHRFWNGLTSTILMLLPVIIGVSIYKYSYLLVGSTWFMLGIVMILALVLIVLRYLSDIHSFYLLFIACLLLRMVFNGIALPERHARDSEVGYKEMVMALGHKYKDASISLYKNSKVDYTNSFYFARARGKITSRTHSDFSRDQYYIYDSSRYEQVVFNYNVLDSFQVREDDRMLYIIQPLE